MNKPDFEKELIILINKYSLENTSNTPDFLLREYLMNCLDTYEKTTQQTTEWHQTSLVKNNFLEK